MGIEETIEKVEIEFEENYGGKTIEEYLEKEINNQKTIKIEISTAIFIHRKYIEKADYVTVDVIPFHHIKSCNAVLKEEEKNIGLGIVA